MSNGKVFNIKVVGNFLQRLIDIKLVQNGVWMRPESPDYGRV
jgi:hypothetical protein